MAQKEHCIAIENIPSGRLPTSLIHRRLLRFLAQPSGTIRVLFSHGLPVGQVLRAVTHHDQRANLGSVDSHICIDARSVRDLLLLSGSHLE